MNEYCNHCAPKFSSTNSFVGITKFGKLAHVVCSGCGVTYVNHLGECQKCNYHKKSSHRNLRILLLMLSLALLAFVTIYLIN